jgi:hypothetical protein
MSGSIPLVFSHHDQDGIAVYVAAPQDSHPSEASKPQPEGSKISSGFMLGLILTTAVATKLFSLGA